MLQLAWLGFLAIPGGVASAPATSTTRIATKTLKII